MQQDITIPANVEAEKGLIGSILLDSTILNKVEGRLLERDFYEQRNRIIFASLISLYREGKNVDITSLISDLETKDTLTKAGGFEYISSLADIGYSTRNAETYIKFIEDASLRRDALKLLQTLTEKGYQGNTTTENFIDDMETSVFALSKRKKTGTFTNIKNIGFTFLYDLLSRETKRDMIHRLVSQIEITRDKNYNIEIKNIKFTDEFITKSSKEYLKYLNKIMIDNNIGIKYQEEINKDKLKVLKQDYDILSITEMKNNKYSNEFLENFISKSKEHLYIDGIISCPYVEDNKLKDILILIPKTKILLVN